MKPRHAFISLFLVAVMLVATLPISAFSASAASNISRTGTALFDSASGDLRGFVADINLDVASNSVKTSSTWGSTRFIAGSFTSVNTSPATNLAMLDTSSGDLLWAGDVNGAVNSSAVVGDFLYIAGAFSLVQGQPRAGLARYVLTSGTPILDAWTLDTNAAVGVLQVDASGGVYAGGSFTVIGGQARAYGAYITSSGTLGAWDPGANAAINAIALDASVVYLGGEFTTLSANAASYLGRVDATSGAFSGWVASTNNAVNDLDFNSDKLFVAGNFTLVNGSPRTYAAVFSRPIGLDPVLDAWSPDINAAVTSIAGAPGKVVVVGGFSSVNGRVARGGVILDSLSGATLKSLEISRAALAPSFVAWAGTDVFVGGGLTASAANLTNNYLAAINSTTGIADSLGLDINGPVLTSHLVGSTLFIGGAFTQVNGQARSNLASVNISSIPAVLTTFAPSFNGVVTDLISDGAILYAAGPATIVEGSPAASVVKLNAVSGARDLAFAPILDAGAGVVRAMQLQGSTLYLGGAFTNLNGLPVLNLAAVSTATGVSIGIAMDADASVNALSLSGSLLYVGGEFNSLGGSGVTQEVRPFLGAVDILTGLAAAWLPAVPNASVANLIVANASTIVASGLFTGVGAAPRAGLAAWDSTSGLITGLNVSASSTPTALASDGTTLFIGGLFTAVDSNPRQLAAAVNLASGNITTWYTNFDLASNSVSNIAVAGAYLLLGGDFIGAGLPASAVVASSSASLAGVPEVGLALSAVAPSWVSSTVPSLSFQWQSGINTTSWVDIAGATSSSYVLTPAEHLRLVRVVVTGTTPGQGSRSVVSAATGSILYPILVAPMFVAEPGNSQVTLTWAPVLGANNYAILRDGIWINTLGSGDTSWLDSSVSNGTLYSYSMASINLGGVSGPTSQAQAVTPYPPLLLKPTLRSVGSGPGSLRPNWVRVFGADRMNILLNGAVVKSVGGTETSATISDLQPSVLYSVQVQAVDVFGRVSEASDVLTQTTGRLPANTPRPGVHFNSGRYGGGGRLPAPTNFSVTPRNAGALLVWAPVAGATGYQILRDEVSLQRVPAGASNFLDLSLTNGVMYSYRIRAVNGPTSQPVTVVPVASSIAAPTNLRALSNPSQTLVLYWTVVPDATQYAIYLDGVERGRTTETVFQINDLRNDVDYDVSVAALSASKEYSAATAVTTRPQGSITLEVPATGTRLTPAPAPSTTELNLTVTDRRSDRGTLVWNKIDGAASYEFYFKGILVGITDQTQITAVGIRNQVPTKVIARDAAGNEITSDEVLMENPDPVITPRTKLERPEPRSQSRPSLRALLLTAAAILLFFYHPWAANRGERKRAKRRKQRLAAKKKAAELAASKEVSS